MLAERLFNILWIEQFYRGEFEGNGKILFIFSDRKSFLEILVRIVITRARPFDKVVDEVINLKILVCANKNS